MNYFFKLTRHSLVLFLLAGHTLFAQDKVAAIDKIFSASGATTPGCVCAISQNGKVVVNKAYGMADLERETPLSVNAIFDAGSVVKQFVAAAVLMLVEDGTLSMTEDIHRYVPELPVYGHKITIDHLLTHTSGIRDWTGIAALSEGSADALTLAYRQRALNFVPGEEWSYSNTGYALLKEIVARKSGMSFEAFSQKHLFEPLGMKLTAYKEDLKLLVKNRALPYAKAGNSWKLDQLLDNERGGGGALLSNPSDLLIWNEALTSGKLGVFVTAKLQEPAKLNNGRKLGYARGLLPGIFNGTPEIAHTGSAASYKTYLGRYPEQGLSIAIMCNSGEEAGLTAIARRIFSVFVQLPNIPANETGAPPAVPDDVVADIEAKAGLYFNELTGEPLRLTVDRARFRVANGPGLVPVSKNIYRRWGTSTEFMSGDAFELHFLVPGGLTLKTMEGKLLRYRSAIKYTPTATELAAFTGKYHNAEIGGFLEISPGKDGVLIRLNNQTGQASEFKPADKDTFQTSRITIKFIRDKTGKVTGLNFSNPILRNILYKRGV